MRKDHLIFLLVLIPIGVILILLASSFSSGRINNPFAKTTPFPTISDPSISIIPNETITPAASQNIEVLSPTMGEKVKSGFVVSGNARTFENNVAIRLSDSAGNVLIETFTLANAPDTGQFGPFEKQINFQTADTEGTLQVFQYSAKDGSIIDLVEVPVLFTN